MTTLGLSRRSDLHKTPDPRMRSNRVQSNSNKIATTEAKTVRRRTRLRDQDPNRSPFRCDQACRAPAQQMEVNPAALLLSQLIPVQFLRLQLVLLLPARSAPDCCSAEDPSAVTRGAVQRRAD